jgi:hypothetical protein
VHITQNVTLQHLLKDAVWHGIYRGLFSSTALDPGYPDAIRGSSDERDHLTIYISPGCFLEHRAMRFQYIDL